MLIAQISDMHVLGEGWVAFGSIDTNGALSRAVAAINAMVPRPDAVLVTGDMTNDGTEDQYPALRDRLDALTVPYFPILGNHDGREAARATFADLPFVPKEGDFCYRVDLGGISIVALDSHVPGAAGGEIGKSQLAWLDAELTDIGDLPSIVMLHHPPFETGIAFMDGSVLDDSAALAEVIARYPTVERVLCGHLHRPIQKRFAGTIAMTAPGTAHQVTLDLAGGMDARWIAEPPALLLHRLEEGALVTHVAYLEDRGPDVPFSDEHRRAG